MKKHLSFFRNYRKKREEYRRRMRLDLSKDEFYSPPLPPLKGAGGTVGDGWGLKIPKTEIPPRNRTGECFLRFSCRARRPEIFPSAFRMRRRVVFLRAISTLPHFCGLLSMRRFPSPPLTSKSIFRPYHIMVHWSSPPLSGRSPFLEFRHIAYLRYGFF